MSMSALLYVSVFAMTNLRSVAAVLLWFPVHVHVLALRLLRPIFRLVTTHARCAEPSWAPFQVRRLGAKHLTMSIRRPCLPVCSRSDSDAARRTRGIWEEWWVAVKATSSTLKVRQ